MLGLALALALTAQAAERRYALLVDANLGDAGEVPLRYADDDAARLGQVLLAQGDVAPTDLVRLSQPDANELRAALGRLVERVAREREDRTLIFVYYSGHADASDLHLGGTRLPLTELRTLVHAIPADARVLVLDACRAGELTRARGATPAAPFQIVAEDELTTEGIAIVTSAAAGEDAQESDRLQGGVFTHHFVAALRGAADTSGDLRVSLTEAYRYTYGRTVATTSGAPALQHPSFSLDLTGRADLVLTRLDEPGRAGRLTLPEPGEYLIFDGRGLTLVLEASLPQGGTLTLPPGRYLVRRRTPSRIYEAEITLDAADALRLEAEALAAVPVGQATRRGGGPQRASLSVDLGGGGRLALPESRSLSPEAQLGLRLDLPQLSVTGRASGSTSESANETLSMRQETLTLSLGALKLVDVGRWSLGAGVSAGGGLVRQRFETDGLAPDRRSGVGLAGSSLRVERALVNRLAIGLDLGLDGTFFLREDTGSGAVLETQVVPWGGLDVAIWLF